ncbi:MAG: tripartite tricarboxylate transporter substrate binding protein [Betaproteobacteria bacterium]|nr:tripartite tricarboxylate transporter substrate binding protein [Betaproteobacteria bacterium]
MRNKLISSSAALAMSLLALCSAAAFAQEAAYPRRPVHLLVPYAAGGATDVFARIVAEAMSARIGQPMVVENKPGGGTVMATGLVAKGVPDGYTLLFTTLVHSINASLYKSLPYDPLEDFEFVGKFGQLGFALIVNRELGVADASGLLALMRAHPGKHQYGSAGVGSPMHLGVELLKSLANIDVAHVPYKGESAALTDLLGGRFAFMLCSVPTCGPRIRDGAIKALALASATRSPLVPSVPSAAEAGMPGFETYTWFMIAAPKNTPRAIVDRLSRTINDVLQDANVRARMAGMGIEADATSSPAGTRAHVQREIEKWRPIVIATGATTN